MFTMINLMASNIETLNLKSMELDGGRVVVVDRKAR